MSRLQHECLPCHNKRQKPLYCVRHRSCQSSWKVSSVELTGLSQGVNDSWSELFERLETVNPTSNTKLPENRTELSCVEAFGDELLGIACRSNSPWNVILRTRNAIGRRLGRQCKHNDLKVEVSTSMTKSTDAWMNSMTE